MKNVEDIYALSPMQEGLLYHTLADPGSGAYVERVSWSLLGRLNVDAFRTAWEQIVEYHTILRTAFVHSEVDEPLQVVRRRVKVPWVEHDWESLIPSDQEARLKSLIEEERCGFNLSKAPLMRLTLVHLQPKVHHFLWSYHHLLLDGWSVALILKELQVRYEALSQDAPTVTMQTRPYRDYIAWFQQQDFRRAERYWRAALDGFISPTLLGTDSFSQTNGAQTNGYRKQQRYLSTNATSALRAAARQHGLTLNTFILGAWGLLLSRYSGEDDVAFGTVVSGRPAELLGAETMVGLFINTLPLRVRVKQGERVGEWLRRLQAQQLEMREYEYSPLIQVNQWSELKRGIPLFDSIIVFENLPADDGQQQQMSTIEVRNLIHHDMVTGYPLTVAVVPGQVLRIQITYDSTRCKEPMIARTIRHLEKILERMAADVEQFVATLPMLTSNEQRALERWNKTARTYPQEITISELFQQQAERTPEAVALVCKENEEVTYGELSRRANRVARRLREEGVGREERVGLCVERTVEMVVGVLGILRSGGALVPLEPEYPEERLWWQARDAGMRVVLVDEAGRARGMAERMEREGVQVMSVEEAGGEQEDERDREWEWEIRGTDLAYVIYTSGSTGRPKGVAIEHRQLMNTLLGAQEIYQLTGADVVPCLASMAFDIFLFELLSPLLAGARCVLLGSGQLLEAGGCAAILEQVTFLHAPAGLMREVVGIARREGEVGRYGQLRTVCVGGEAVTPELVKGMRESFPGARIYIGYGPTEAAIMCANVEVEAERVVEQELVGRPMANVRLRIYDQWRQPTPVGVRGEIYVGGAGVGRGYVQLPELSAERFVEVDGERCYRTGDLGRWMSDGVIEFLGRADDQVKLRGFRIELGEVARVLEEHDGINEAVVRAREEGPGEKRLVAYVVSEEGVTVSAEELRRHLGARLPEYMIPTAFVTLKELPLTVHGKVDRQALPEPERKVTAYVGPRNATEEVVCGIWEEVLKVEPVGVADNFFEMGGHSLLATQVMSRVRECLGVEVPLRHLFEQPTAAGFAAQIEAMARAQSAAVLAPPIVPVPRDQPLPLSFAQQRLWFIEQLLPDTGLHNMPVALRLRGHLDVSALRATLCEVVARHEVLRTTFVLEDGGPRQRIAETVVLALPIVDLSSNPQAESESRRLTDAEAMRGFDLTAGPLLRSSLLRLSSDEHILLLTLHHIISDGWSMGVLVQEVSALYTAYVHGKHSPLQKLGVQYGDFVLWQRERLHGQELDRQKEYWRNRLAGSPPVLELPTDRARPSLPSFKGAVVPIDLSPRLTTALKALSRKQGATLFMTLLAAWQVLLARYSGQDDIVVGTPIANRNRAEIEPLVGFFANTLALRADLSADPTFIELLRQVREVCLSAYQHQDLPFEMLVEELAPERNLSHSPVFQVMFALQNAPLGALELPELVLNLMDPIKNPLVNFELNLVASEVGGSLRGSWVYHTDLFDATTIEQMAEHFLILLEGVVSAPDRRISDLPFLSETERRRLDEWNNTGRDDYPRGVCIHELFERQAGASAEGIALISGDRRLTYEELNRRSNQLARYLKQLGVGPGSFVGVCLERSLEIVVAMLAIFKSGGVYVPLDAEHPLERLSLIIKDAGITVLLTTIPPQPGFGERAKVVSLDAAEEITASLAVENLEPQARPTDLAYVIYTSGSTGQPKGVMVEHRQLVNTLCALQAVHGFGAGDTFPCLSPASFDISLFELLTPLLAGGRSLLVEGRNMLDVNYARRVLNEVTHLHAVPSLMRQLLSFTKDGKEDRAAVAYRQLREIFVGGDVVSPNLLADLQQTFPWARIHVLYGPTEGTIVCATYEVGRGERVSHQLVGIPLGNMKLRLYDRRRKLVPVGVDGEIYIGGAGVSRGYLNRDSLTCERYVAIDGERFYRSGDVGRRLACGTVVFVGRLDDQVKIHGFRVEIGEIEAALAAHAGLKECAVLARPDVTGEGRLTAFVVAKNGGQPAARELRSYLLAKLPQYMIPAEFVVLSELPRTSHGKLDRRALAAFQGSRAELGQVYVAPGTDVQKLIAGVWREVLGVNRVGANDNFFEVGGTSLLLVKIQHALQQNKFELTMIDLFKYPTVGALAEHIERGQPSGPSYLMVYDRVKKQQEIIKQRKEEAKRRRALP